VSARISEQTKIALLYGDHLDEISTKIPVLDGKIFTPGALSALAELLPLDVSLSFEPMEKEGTQNFSVVWKLPSNLGKKNVEFTAKTIAGMIRQCLRIPVYAKKELESK